ncbi:MAG TPA: vitamin K epoxide reductase family protein, partial [Prolixibacteraceae bacterium]|nr:vitamin K epoxide reductase family protein [Prolixibacteraceae bacterium]
YEVKQLIISDIISGFALIVLGFLSLNPTRYWAMWTAGFVGGWLCMAPLIFEAKTAVAYTQGTIMGTLVMLFMLVIPNIPGIVAMRKEGNNVPEGWTYNPSSWPERIPVVILGWLGFVTARYLTGYQLGFSDNIWDPFFGDGTKQILTSSVSKSFPVSDAGLGAFAYILDVVTGLAGRTGRWRTMPWVVLIFGFLVIPLGIVSLTLVILQPVVVGSWCTACLFSALITVGMIPFTFDEVLASVQFLWKKKQEGKSLWHTFWFGDAYHEGETKIYDKPGNEQFKGILNSLWEDLKLRPWNLFVAIGIGLWFMFSPSVLGYTGKLADSNHLVGAIIIAMSIIAMSEVVRSLRFVNILLAAWLIASIWIFGYTGSAVLWSQLIAGIVLIAVSFRKGVINDTHGGFNKHIK